MALLKSISAAFKETESKKDDVHRALLKLALDWKDIEQQFDTSQTCFQECFAELESREKHLSCVQESLAGKHKQVEDKEMEVLRYADGLKLREEKFIQQIKLREEMLDEKEKLIQGIFEQQAKLENVIEGKIKEIEEQFQKRAYELNSKEEQLNQRLQLIGLKEDRFLKQGNELDSKENQMKQRLEEIGCKEEQFKKRGCELDSKEEHMKKRLKEIALKEEQFMKRAHELDSKEEHMRQRLKEIGLKEEQFRKRAYELDSKEERLKHQANERISMTARQVQVDLSKSHLDSAKGPSETSNDHQLRACGTLKREGTTGLGVDQSDVGHQLNPPKRSKAVKSSEFNKAEQKIGMANMTVVRGSWLGEQHLDTHEFDKDKEKIFAVNQIWACYDNLDGMPRYYAQVKKVLTPERKLQMVWLEADHDFPVSCGRFRQGTNCIDISTCHIFSHQVQWKMDKQGYYFIYPMKGETWALYRDDIRRSSEQENYQQSYDIVEVLSDFEGDSVGIRVISLDKVSGSVSTFQRNSCATDNSFVIKANELDRFSHKVPSYKLVEESSFEMDPASLPNHPNTSEGSQVDAASTLK